MSIVRHKSGSYGWPTAALAFLAVAILPVPAFAGGACPQKGAIKALKPPSCDPKTQPSCGQCKNEIQQQNQKARKAFDAKVGACNGTETSCAGAIQGDVLPLSAKSGSGARLWITWFSDLLCENAEASRGDTQLNNMGDGKSTSGKTAQCERTAANQSRQAAQVADDCAKAIEQACSGISEAKKEAKKCKKAADDARKKATEDEAKAQEADKNANKDADNQKKEGGMPQMPQIPQMPQNQSQDPQLPDPLASEPTVSSATAAEIETSKIGDPLVNGVGFGADSSTDTATSTIAPLAGATAASYPIPQDVSPLGASSLGANGPAGGSFGSYGGASGGGGAGPLNTTGASAPGDGTKAAEAPASSPYEVNPAGGGKLGAPKGFKGGGEPDALVAEAAKESFKADLGLDQGRNLASEGDQGGDETDDGYTLFKMVRYRYVELKKRGNI
jgi:hypothetical protein